MWVLPMPFASWGLRLGVAVGIIDAGKGALAVLIAQTADVPQVVLFAGVAAVIGHNWPIFLGFKGGRGESTTIGVLLALVTQPMLIVGGVSVVTLLITKNVLLASAVLFIPLPLACWWLGFRGCWLVIVLPCPAWWALPTSSGQGRQQYVRPNHYRAEVK